jgi:hypothetical protein
MEYSSDTVPWISLESTSIFLWGQFGQRPSDFGDGKCVSGGELRWSEWRIQVVVDYLSDSGNNRKSFFFGQKPRMEGGNRQRRRLLVVVSTMRGRLLNALTY